MRKFDKIIRKRENEIALGELDPLSISIYRYLLERIQYSKTPKPITLEAISRSCACTRQQTKYRIMKLIDKKLLEKWTTKHPTKYKISYFRMVYPGDRRALYVKNTKKLASTPLM